MRILVWMQTYLPDIGGIQVWIKELLPALQAVGHEVIVVASQFSFTVPEVMTIDCIAVYRFHFLDALRSNNPAIVLKERRRVTKLVEQFAPDIINVVGYGSNVLFFSMVREVYPCPFVFSVHNQYSDQLQIYGRDSMLHKILSTADWITTVSQLEADRLAELNPQIASKISCIYLGLMQPEVALTALPSTPRLLCIGRQVEQKNFALAIRAFAKVAPDFPTARLIFAGDGVERPNLEQLVSNLELADQVEFLGWVQPEEIPALINQGSAVVLPSRWEGLPLTGIQAAQMARPLIATCVSGIPELVVNGETGYLVPSEDEEALAGAMRAILADPTRAAQMGQIAHERIYEKFSLAGTVEAHTKLFERVLQHANIAME